MVGETVVGKASNMGSIRDGKVQEQWATFVQSQGMANKANMIVITNHKGEGVGMDADSFDSIPEELHKT